MSEAFYHSGGESGLTPRRRFDGRTIGMGLALIALALLFFYFAVWRWMICRVEVQPGQSLMLRYKGPFPPFLSWGAKPSADGLLVKTDSWGRPQAIGILEEMPGPGRHFFNPFEYEMIFVPDTVIPVGKIGIVTSKVGQPLPPGEILADSPEFKGTWRRVLTPGRYRLNTKYAYEIKVMDAMAAAGKTARSEDEPPVMIAPGYVGVVTIKAPNPKTGEKQGIQDHVLQPGIYYANPEEKKIDVISIGFNEFSVAVKKDPSARPVAVQNPSPTAQNPETTFELVVEPDPVFLRDSGIDFPSSDGFQIFLDYTAIWGILPDQAPGVIRRFGTLEDVKTKVIQPQIGSICRLHGSKRGAVEMLVGDSREEFQEGTSEDLEKVLADKDLTLLFGLTRHIYVPAAARAPLQRAKIANEIKLTRDQEQQTAKAQADLTEAIAKIGLEQKKTETETKKMAAQTIAEGQKEASEIEAETEKIIAEIEAKTAEIDAQIATTLGQADAMKTEMANEAEAERYSLYVKALGGPDNYNRYMFAEGLPDKMGLGIFYAGPGTFWTDLRGFEQAVMGKVASEADKSSTAAPGLKASLTMPGPADPAPPAAGSVSK